MSNGGERGVTRFFATPDGRLKAVKFLGTILLWLVILAEGVSMVDAGLGKFRDVEGWQYWFGQWGYPVTFATLIGIVEIGGAILLFVPLLSTYAATLLGAVMAGAIYTLAINESDLSMFDPSFHLILLLIIATFRYRRRWVPKTIATVRNDSS